MHFQLHRSPGGEAMTGADEAGNEIRLSLPEIAGGNVTGFRPMQLMIFSFGGCTAADVLSILRKMRQEVTGLRLDIEADRFQQPLPNPWEKIHVVYTISGQVERQKAERAVTLSIEKYCSASETLRLAGATITWEVVLPDAEPG